MCLFDPSKEIQEPVNHDKTDSSILSLVSAPTGIDPFSFVVPSTIDPDERCFYRPDTYYTYYSYPGTIFQKRIVTFEERKQISYPSSRGLYVGEIILLEYCSKGKYPKPTFGYPGFWWFEYGIRDVGHALESLEKRGFIRWQSKSESLYNLNVDELKIILKNNILPVSGKKSDLIKRIIIKIPENKLNVPSYAIKYVLTDLGKDELADNGYVPYMHRHKLATIESHTFGEPFNVWEINKLFPDGNAKDWRRIVGEIEKERFGVDIASSPIEDISKERITPEDLSAKGERVRKYLLANKGLISQGICSEGNGYIEESKGLDYKALGKDKEALFMFFIAIGKRFDAPELYIEAASLLRKYSLLEEELSVVEAGISCLSNNDHVKADLIERREQIQELIKNK
ncbi:MAG: SAP domain-containing protein [Clostridia bacterium]|nr:SAP domain-containing protein [Clostridia bacterium]